MNWLDIVIILVLAYYAYAGMRHGFLRGMLELVGLIVSLAVPFLLYAPAGGLLERVGVSPVYSGALAFLIIWFITSAIYFALARRLYRRLPRRVRAARTNRAFGVIPGIIRGVIMVAVILTILIALPTGLVTQETVEGSLIASPMVNAMTTVATYAGDIFGEAVRTALGFITVEPETPERVNLPFRVDNPRIDPAAEQEMLRLVNLERARQGVQPLIMDSMTREVARDHSIDMFRRGYFSHVTPDGVDPFQRMRRGGVRFVAAGENIALAQTVEIAHRGLMNSPGHRANILRPQFRRVGIGAARGGRHGIMFTQNFAN